MHGLRPGCSRGGDDRRDVEVAGGGFRRADPHGGVGGARVQRVAVGVREHRHTADAHAPAGAGDAAGYLAAIGDQDGAEHRSTNGIKS
jgi:hypothetical protein